MKIDVVDYSDPHATDRVRIIDLPNIPRKGDEIEWPDGSNLTVFRVVHWVQPVSKNAAWVQVSAR